MEQYKTVNKYIEAKVEWQYALILLRDILNDLPVDEGVKWGAPIYTFKDKNIIGLAAFKGYVGLWFHQGVFLKDELEVLINANTENTKGLRQWRFKDVLEVERNAEAIKMYVLEAIENEKKGLRINIERGKLLNIPDELKVELANDADLKKAFEKMSLSKQREFTEYISSAKRVATKNSRLVKISPMILRGEGLNDKYRPK